MLILLYVVSTTSLLTSQNVSSWLREQSAHTSRVWFVFGLTEVTCMECWGVLPVPCCSVWQVLRRNVKKSIVFAGTGTMLQLYSALPNTGSITQMPTTTIHARITTTIAIPSKSHRFLRSLKLNQNSIS